MTDDAERELVLLVRAWLQRREIAGAPPGFRAFVTDLVTRERYPAPTPDEMHRVLDDHLRALLDDGSGESGSEEWVT